MVALGKAYSQPSLCKLGVPGGLPEPLGENALKMSDNGTPFQNDKMKPYVLAHELPNRLAKSGKVEPFRFT